MHLRGQGEGRTSFSRNWLTKLCKNRRAVKNGWNVINLMCDRLFLQLEAFVDDFTWAQERSSKLVARKQTSFSWALKFSLAINLFLNLQNRTGVDWVQSIFRNLPVRSIYNPIQVHSKRTNLEE